MTVSRATKRLIAEELGDRAFTLGNGGKHPFVTFLANGRTVKVSLPSTPGDRRNDANLRARFRQVLGTNQQQKGEPMKVSTYPTSYDKNTFQLRLSVTPDVYEERLKGRAFRFGFNGTRLVATVDTHLGRSFREKRFGDRSLVYDLTVANLVDVPKRRNRARRFEVDWTTTGFAVELPVEWWTRQPELDLTAPRTELPTGVVVEPKIGPVRSLVTQLNAALNQLPELEVRVRDGKVVLVRLVEEEL